MQLFFNFSTMMTTSTRRNENDEGTLEMFVKQFTIIILQHFSQHSESEYKVLGMISKSMEQPSYE